MALTERIKSYISNIPDEMVRNALKEIAEESFTVDDFVQIMSEGVTFSKVNNGDEPQNGEEVVLVANFTERFRDTVFRRRLPWEAP